MAATRLIAVWTSVLIAIASVAATTPQVNFPLNSQFPPIARVGLPYSFQFALATFQPEPDKLQYSLIGHPSWLSLSSENRTLWGTPGASDTGIAIFTIAAAGEAGAVANMESKLLVADDQAPMTKGNVSEHLSRAGQLSGARTVTLLPSKPFDIVFPLDTFDATGEKLIYHATLADHTPLPTWISFDAASLHFAGTTPPLLSATQEFDILLIASDNPDFAAATLSFGLVVSDHRLFFRPVQQEIQLAKGDFVNITGLLNNLFLDDNPIGNQDIQSTSADIPPWLSFDSHTLDIAGTPPDGLMSQDVSITVTDKFGDTATHSIRLSFKSQLFEKEIGTLNITAGQQFNYKIPNTVLLSEDEAVTIDFGPLGNWLRLDRATLTITGTLPETIRPQDVEATMEATSRDGKLRDSQTFHFNVASSGASRSPNTNDSADAQRPSNADDGFSNEQHEHTSKSKAGVVAGSVVGALVASVVLFIFACILCRRKKRSKGYISPKSPRSPKKTDISRPIIEDWDAADKSLDPDLEKGDGDDTLLERTPEHPPQLNLDLAHKPKASESSVSSISELESKALEAFDNSTWGFKDEAGPSHRPHDSMKIPTAMARRESEKSDTPTKHRRRTTTVYRDPHRSSGPPVNRRLTGLGHGRHTLSPSRSNNYMSSYRRPLSCNSNSTISTSILSAVPSASTQAPATRHTTQLTTPMDKRCSIRVVSKNSSLRESALERRAKDAKRRSGFRSSICDSLADLRTIDEKRQSYIRKRASAQSPFFGASSSRMSSSSYKLPPSFANESETSAKPAPSPLFNAASAKYDDEGVQKVERELPESLRIRKPSETPSVETPRTFEGSLRKPVVARPFVNRHQTLTPTTPGGDRVYKRYDRPSTSHSGSFGGRRSSARQSQRAQELKSSLNSLTGSKIFEDAEMSESVYSTEEEDIEEYEKRSTVRPNDFSLPPLDLYRLRKGQRDSKRDSRDSKASKRDSKTKAKKFTKRDATPFSLAIEHGGKENKSSTYSLSLLPSSVKSTEKFSNASQPQERPKTIATASQQPARTAHHNRAKSRTTAPSSTQRDSPTKSKSHKKTDVSRHSRTKSTSGNSHSSSQKSTTKHTRDRSRTQSSAYPYFDLPTLPSADLSKHNQEGHLIPQADTAASLLSRDLDGNIQNYALHEDPTIEELDSSSIGFRTSNGRINSSARQSRLAQQMTNTDSSSGVPYANRATASIGLGLSLLGGSIGRREQTPGLDRERSPLGVLDDGNGASPDRLRVVEGNGKRPVSVEVGDELKAGASKKGRTTWGSLRAVIPRGYWDGRDREMKAFL